MKCKTDDDEEEEDAPEMQYQPQRCMTKAKFYISFFLPDYSSNFLQLFQTAGYFCNCSILNTYLHNSNDALVAYAAGTIWAILQFQMCNSFFSSS